MYSLNEKALQYAQTMVLSGAFVEWHDPGLVITLDEMSASTTDASRFFLGDAGEGQDPQYAYGFMCKADGRMRVSLEALRRIRLQALRVGDSTIAQVADITIALSGVNFVAPASDSADHAAPEDSKDWVPIFSAGRHKDARGVTRNWTEEQLDTMVEAHQAQVEANEDLPRLRLGDHSTLKPKVGLVPALRRAGEFLQAKFTDVPAIVAKAIRSKLYDDLSSGIAFNREIAGRVYSHVLDHVSILGGELPAVQGLPDLEQYFSRTDEVTAHGGELAVHTFSQEEEPMTKPKNDPDTGDQGDAKVAEYQRENADLTTERDALKAQVAEHQKRENDKAVTDLVSKALEGGHITPALEDAAKSVGAALRENADHSTGDDSPWQGFTDLLTKGKMVEFTEKSENDKDADAGDAGDGEGSEFQKEMNEGARIAKNYQSTDEE